MSLTKIKDAFAIFKNFVLESRAENKNKSSNITELNSPSGKKNKENSMNSNTKDDYEKQIRDLKSLLFQRDTEISILVSMVKKGKTVNDVHGFNSTNSESEITSFSHKSNYRNEEKEDDRLGNGGNSSNVRGGERDNGRDVGKEKDREREREREREIGNKRKEELSSKFSQSNTKQSVGSRYHYANSILELEMQFLTAHCTTQYCTALHCTALHCTAQY